MADAITRLVVDCSVVVKWKIPTEDHAVAAEALFIDWEHQVVDVSVPNHFPSEGTHLRRDTVIPQGFQASKAAAARDGHAVHL